LYKIQSFIQINLHFVQMDPSPRLDRLSALLSGLAPRVHVMLSKPNQSRLRFPAEATAGLWLHLVLDGKATLLGDGIESLTAEAPVMMICRVNEAHELDRLMEGASAPDGLLCARAHFDGPVGPLLLAEFAQPMMVPLADADASLQQVITLVRAELNQPRCGQPLLLDRAGDILFIGLLRHLVAHPRTASGLLQGLSDPRIASILVALHTKPQAEWRLETMASMAGMSRTAFANRFREALNTTPGKYLSQLRLAIAQRAVASGDGLKTAARLTGYTNASALSRALSRARSSL
jgi:AraC-like DNA-binding protein